MKHLRFLVMSLVLAFAVSSCSAISAAVPVLAKVATIAANANDVLQVIDHASDEWFSKHPDPVKQGAVDKAISNCHLAIAAATSAAQGAKDLDEGRANEAFEQFRTAYKELELLLQSTGVLNGGKFGADPGAPPLPRPLALDRIGA